MIDIVNDYASLLTFLTTLILAIITGYYALITRKILNATREQSKLALDPVIGIEIKEISFTPVFAKDRRHFNVETLLTNVGSAPAIGLLFDAEIELRYSNIKGKNIIPCRFEPFMSPFLKIGESHKTSLNFGHLLILHFFDDVRESTRLNEHRINTNPHKEAYNTSILRVFIYYKNSLGQHFKSFYQVEIGMSSYRKAGEPAPELPKKDESGVVQISYIPRPIYENKTITKNEMDKEISERNNDRILSGY